MHQHTITYEVRRRKTHLGSQRSEIISSTNTIRTDIRSEGSERKRKTSKECRGAIVPLIDEPEWVPDVRAVEDVPGGGDDDADECGESEEDGDDDELDVLTGKERLVVELQEGSK